MHTDTQILLTGPMLPLVVDALDRRFATLRPMESGAMADFLRSDHPQVRGIATTSLHGPVGAALFDRLPNLEIVANFGVGYDHVDVAEARRRGIVVTNTPDVLTDEVADLALGLLIAAVRQIPAAEQHLRSGQWRERPFPLTASLRGRRVGIVGLGRIGKAIARRCAAFDLPIAYHGRQRQPDVAYPYYASAVELAAAVDTLIVAAPGGADTRRLIDAAVLAALGADGVLVNIARGSLVDEAALIDALKNRRILAAGLDVFDHEPRIDEAFYTLPNAVLLPHVGSASVHTRNAMGQLVIDNLLSWFDGKGPVTPV